MLVNFPVIKNISTMLSPHRLVFFLSLGLWPLFAENVPRAGPHRVVWANGSSYNKTFT